VASTSRSEGFPRPLASGASTPAGDRVCTKPWEFAENVTRSPGPTASSLCAEGPGPATSNTLTPPPLFSLRMSASVIMSNRPCESTSMLPTLCTPLPADDSTFVTRLMLPSGSMRVTLPESA